MFILRHLVHAAKSRNVNKQVYTAFIDFKQAYDKVNRGRLWSHLSGAGLPTQLLDIVRDMYTGDKYELIDGPKRSGPMCPANGLKQGCPLSPLLFSLYVNDVKGQFASSWGAETGMSGVRVPLLMYADDLTLMSNDPNHLQLMLNKLQNYAEQRA
jgi:hypothetical protein